MFDIAHLETNKNLAHFSTYKIGGPADYFCIVRSKEELVKAIISARKNTIPFFVLGLGANILFGDKGFRGLVIKNEAEHVSFDNNTVTAESGTKISDLIEETKNRNLSGFENFAGIPSTIGGALWQNLHFLTPDRKDTFYIEKILKSAEILDENNNILKVDKDFFKFSYDYSILHDRDLIILEADFKLFSLDKNIIQKQIDENIKWRTEKHPSLDKFPSCGSVFKKVEGIGVGRLIEEVGLKGYRVGGAEVSKIHSNFIVNLGNATAKDVIDLIELIKKTVKTKTGYHLETEIKFIGEF